MTVESSRLTSRVAGVFYLLNIASIFLAIVCFRGIIVPRDAAATAANLQAHEMAFRFGSALEVISTACSIVVAALLYQLLEHVNAGISLVAAFFRLTACAIAVFGYVFQLAPLTIAGDPAIPLLLYRLHGPASDIVIIFFGFHFIALGYLFLKSSPRLLGVLAAVTGFGALIFLAPPIATRVFLYFAAPGLLTELSLTGWLLAGGPTHRGL